MTTVPLFNFEVSKCHCPAFIIYKDDKCSIDKSKLQVYNKANSGKGAM
jgi:hypothetical protein